MSRRAELDIFATGRRECLASREEGTIAHGWCRDSKSYVIEEQRPVPATGTAEDLAQSVEVPALWRGSQEGKKICRIAGYCLLMRRPR